MNTNALKKFAREARIKLIGMVSQKLEYVLSHDTAELRGKKDQIDNLKKEIARSGREQVIDRVAYTWFNRIIALRFMDANGYTAPKVVSPLPGSSVPEILQEAKAGHIDDKLKLDRQRLNDLLDGKTNASDPQTEVYKMLFISSCNAWNSVMPAIFERIADYSELLIPDDLLSEFSIVTLIREGMTDEDCREEELIGWLYQFYIADKKDEVFDGLKKNKKITPENIPAATQLFTPRWIVRYMVENTLGKIWLTLKPSSSLRGHMPYYIEAPEGNSPSPLPDGIKGVTDITFLDPCMGSGHILVYAFELFTRMYEEEGYSPHEIPELIFTHNLFGFDIDQRASQLALFALMMKARAYYPRFLRKPVQPQVIALENVSPEIIKQAVKIPLAVSGKLVFNHEDLSLYQLTQADNFGSLIQIDPEELKAIEIQKGSLWQEQEAMLHLQGDLLSRKYHCVVTNPPYMGDNGMNAEIKLFVKEFYKRSKTDLMACFVERCLEFGFMYARIALINQHSWMFLSSYEELRSHMIEQYQIESMLHLGPRTFPEIGGEVVQNVAFVLGNYKPIGSGNYFRLTEFDSSEIKRNKTLEAIKNPKCVWSFTANQKDLKKIASHPIAYWISPNVIKVFQNQTLENYATLFQGIITGHNSHFVRYWHEVSYSKTNLNLKDFNEFRTEDGYWVPYNKGGNSRKWYGNHEMIVNFSGQGKDFTRGKLQFSKYFFKPCFSWTYISSKDIDARYFPSGFLWDVAGSSAFPHNSEDIYYFIAIIGTKIGSLILQIINPTINFQVENIAAVPIIYPAREIKDTIISHVQQNISIAEQEWNLHETSWNFNCNALILSSKNNVSIAVKEFTTSWSEKFHKLHKNENTLNSLLIKTYGLEKEINPVVSLDSITILQEESKISNEELVFDISMIINQLISYSVGCLFGRFSIDIPGLVFANQGAEIKDYFKQIPNPRFMPDEDNIVPVMAEEYFTDDIVGRFNEFIKVAFGPEHYQENLQFIEEAIGKDIRKYFVKDFYNDHIKRYKKRPIYWMFSSPKGHFKVLIYMHRYRPDTVSKILNDYLRVFIGKLEANRQSLTSVKLNEHASTRERALADKKIVELEAMIKDCREYEKTLFEVAAQKIEIDLDDGVKVNYMKFKDVLIPIKGLEKSEE